MGDTTLHHSTGRYFARSLVLLAIAGVAAAVATRDASAQEFKKYAHEFYHDFRGKPLSNELHIVGKPDGSFIKEEPAGLRIALPNTWIHPFGGVGCRTNFSIQGDFEVTGTFEILRADEPTKGFGVGASLRVQLADPHPEGATLARVVRAGGNQILVWDRVPEKGGKTIGGVHKCADKLLRLRLTRTGKSLHYAWAPGLVGDDFDEIRAIKEFGDGDIVAVRMNVLTGREPCNVDVRFLELRIGSGGLVDAAAKGAPPLGLPANNLQPNPPEAAPSPRSSLLFAVVIGIGLTVFLMIAFATAFLIKRRRTNVEQPTGDAGAELEYVTFACPACGKHLKAKTVSIGKKIKCVQCGQTTAVPERETA